MEVSRVTRETRKVMVALEDNEDGLYSLQWALDHLVPSEVGSVSCDFVLLYVAQDPMASAPLTGKEIAFSGHLLRILEKNQKRKAQRVIEQAQKLCEKHDIVYQVKVSVGEAKVVICNAAKKLGVDLLVVGDHSSGRLKRFFSAGDIGQYCNKHAKCPVVVVEKPQQDF